MTPNQIANTRPPDTISEVGGLNGWMLLVGIVAGTVIMVSLVWNSMKLWCRKCERDALTQPPTITYLTQDQALTNTNAGGNRLAEVPVSTLSTFQIEIQVEIFGPIVLNCKFFMKFSFKIFPLANMCSANSPR